MGQAVYQEPDTGLSHGVNYVTVCTKDMECLFGEIIDGKMHLSIRGAIVGDEWLKTPRIRSYVELDEWRIMPNHVHGIIIINEHRPVNPSGVETTRRVVSTTPQPSQTLPPASLGSIIGQVKSASTKRIWDAGFISFSWQERYFDHIHPVRYSLKGFNGYTLHICPQIRTGWPILHRVYT